MDSTLLKNIYRMQFAYFPKLLKRFFSSGLYNVGEININSLQFFLSVISLLSSVFSIKKNLLHNAYLTVPSPVGSYLLFCKAHRSTANMRGAVFFFFLACCIGSL